MQRLEDLSGVLRRPRLVHRQAELPRARQAVRPADQAGGGGDHRGRPGGARPRPARRRHGHRGGRGARRGRARPRRGDRHRAAARPAGRWRRGAVDTGAGETVALDLEVTPELRRAGLVREVIRLVQEARKSTRPGHHRPHRAVVAHRRRRARPGAARAGRRRSRTRFSPPRITEGSQPGLREFTDDDLAPHLPAPQGLKRFPPARARRPPPSPGPPRTGHRYGARRWHGARRPAPAPGSAIVRGVGARWTLKAFPSCGRRGPARPPRPRRTPGGLVIDPPAPVPGRAGRRADNAVRRPCHGGGPRRAGRRCRGRTGRAAVPHVRRASRRSGKASVIRGDRPARRGVRGRSATACRRGSRRPRVRPAV